MPRYDYECRSCGHVVEVLHGVNDGGPTACEICGSPMRKLMSTPSIVFKGSGWAKKDARDSRTSSKSADTKSADTKSADTKSADTKSADTKSSDRKSAGDSGSKAVEASTSGGSSSGRESSTSTSSD